MGKSKTVYVCDYCGYESSKWMGKCPNCGNWNSFKEFRIPSDVSKENITGLSVSKVNHSEVLPLNKITSHETSRIDLLDTELNRVLGGGLVAGSMVLIGGEPGIGKSTLTLQTFLQINKKVLYVSGEESPQQIKMRAERISSNIPDSFMILSETSLENIINSIKSVKPDLIVIDSIQTIASDTIPSLAGSITQIRESATKLLKIAKISNIPIILIGHITKEGMIAGPKVLEHIVDTVLQFEGDQHYMYRILRSIKNRFGSTSEIGIYEMIDKGLRQVSNPVSYTHLTLPTNREV